MNTYSTSIQSEPGVIKPGLGRRIVLRLCLFFFIFGPVVNVGLGPFGDTLSLICMLLLLWAILDIGDLLVRMPSKIRVLAVILVLTVGYGLVSSLLLGNGEVPLQIFFRPLRALIMLLGIYIFIKHYVAVYRSDVEGYLLYDIFLAISLHAIIMIFQFIFPSVRDFIYPYTFADQADPFNQMFRMAGLTNGGGAQLSLFQAVGCLLWPVIAFKNKHPLWAAVDFTLFLCNVASIVLSGRSGLLLLIVFFPTILLYCVSKNPRLTFKNIIATLLLGFIILFSSFSILAELVVNEESGVHLETAINRASQFFGDDSISNNDGVQALSQMFFIPDSAFVMLFGDPLLFEASYKMEDRIVKSDVGYVNLLFGYGLIGSFIQYSFYSVILFCSFGERRRAPFLALISIVWTVSLFISHAKEILFFSRIGYSITVILFVGLLLHGRTNSIASDSRVKRV